MKYKVQRRSIVISKKWKLKIKNYKEQEGAIINICIY